MTARKLQFAGALFDGKSARKHPVDIELTPREIILKNPGHEPIHWLYPNLRWAANTTNALLEQSVEGNQPYDLRIYIWSEKEVNALALPGGAMLISQGLLNEAESPEELAGVIAHEIQHVLLRHSTRGIIRNLTQSMLLTLFVGDVNATMEKVVNLVSTLETLGLSREMEVEADRKGMELILAANIDPHGMIRIFEKLTQNESSQEEEIKNKAVSRKKDTEFFSYFSTHPSSKNRILNLKKQMKPHENKTWMPLFQNLNWNELKPKN